MGTSQKSRILMPSRLFGRSPYPLVGYDGNHGTSQRRPETEQRARTRSRAHHRRRKRAVRRSRGGHASFGDALLACWRQVKTTAGPLHDTEGRTRTRLYRSTVTRLLLLCSPPATVVSVSLRKRGGRERGDGHGHKNRGSNNTKRFAICVTARGGCGAITKTRGSSAMRARIELGFVRACRHGPGERTYQVSAPNSMSAGKYLAKCLRRENSATRRRNTKQSPGEQTNASEKNPNGPARTACTWTLD